MKSKYLCLLPLVCLSCVMVPKTQITGSLNGQPFSLKSPKDTAWEGIELVSGTNGLSFKVAKVQSKMNPEVITTTGAAQAQMVQTVADAVIKAIATAPRMP